MTDRHRPLVRRRALSILAFAGLSALAGCESSEVGSVPKARKSKAELLKELEAPPPKKGRSRGR
jgi:hypothetical protein